MCGRYVEILEFVQVIREFGHLIGNQEGLFGTHYNFNTPPTENVSVILNLRPYKISRVKWGLIPPYEKPPYKKGLHNVRSEAILKPWHQKPTYGNMLSKCIAEYRCIFLMAGFYEWEDTPPPKQPWFIFDQDRPVFGVAGIYRELVDESTGEITLSAAIITQEANSLLLKVKHDRMPTVLYKEDYALWLDDHTPLSTIKSLLKVKYPSGLMNAYPVNKLGFNNDFENLIPIGKSINAKLDIDITKKYELQGMGGRRNNRPTLFD